MQLGKHTSQKKRSLMWPVLLVLVGGAVICRLNLPKGEPELPIVEESGQPSVWGDVIQGAGNVLMATAGDWHVTDLGVVKLARWEAKSWLEDDAEAEPIRAIALPFTEGWRELERSE